MGLREEIHSQIRFEISENPIARAALSNADGKAAVTTWKDGDTVLNVHAIALEHAILKLADEIEALRSR